MESTRFKGVAQSLLKDSTFADFVLKCGKKEYKVHRFILSCHSEYFKRCFEGKFKMRSESKNKVIEIKEDDAEAVDLTIAYFYAFDYNDEPKPNAKLDTAMLVNAAVYSIAGKYDVVDPKTLAQKKFGLAISNFAERQQNPTPAIRLVYESTPSSDRGLRDICVNVWTLAGTEIATPQHHEAVYIFLQKTPQFAADVAYKMTDMTKGVKVSGGCACHSDHGVKMCNAMQHQWNGEMVGIEIPGKVPQFWRTK